MIITTELRGAYHRDMIAQHKVLSLTLGDEVQLEPEPTNPYDPNAIRVIADDVFIGFIAKEDCEEVHAFIPATARISQIGGLKPLIDITS